MRHWNWSCSANKTERKLEKTCVSPLNRKHLMIAFWEKNLIAFGGGRIVFAIRLLPRIRGALADSIVRIFPRNIFTRFDGDIEITLIGCTTYRIYVIN